MSIYIGDGNQELDFEGCQYSCPQRTQNQYYTPSTKNFSTNFNCTKTGRPASSSSPGSTNAADAAPVTSGMTPDGKFCNETPSGQVSCVGGPIPAGCMTVDGAKVCPSPTTPSEATVNDSPSVQSSDAKNCVSQSGQNLCVTPEPPPDDTTPRPDMVCGEINGKRTCFERQPTRETTVQGPRVVSPDGSETVTTTTDNNILGSDPVTTTTTTHPDGSVSTTTSGDRGGNDGQQQLSEIAKNTKNTSDNTKGILDKLGEIFGSDVGEPDLSGAADGMGTEQCVTDSDGNQTCSGGQGIGRFNPSSPVFSVSNGRLTGGQCPVDKQFYILGKTYVFSFDALCNSAEIVSIFLMFLAYLIAARVIFSSHQSIGAGG